MFRSPKDLLFQTKEKLSSNLNGGYNCDMCEEGPWPTEQDVEIHRKNAHKYALLKALKDEDTSICSICLRVQPDKQSLTEHILVNHFLCPPNATMINREIYICDYCHRLFFNKQLLITHIFHWHTKKTPENANVRYDCPKCWKNIRAKTAWFHLLYHGVFSIGTCPICLKICENHAEMLEHVKTHPYLFRCNICNYETNKECYLNNHLTKHKEKVALNFQNDPTKFFLPEQLLPSMINRMTHIFKGIPLANEVRICILCRTLVFSAAEMHQHIFGAHEPDIKEKSKTHLCYCGEEFFNSVLLKQHIFKLKGNHGAWDGVSPIPIEDSDQAKEEIVNVYQIYGSPITVGMNEIIITGISSDRMDQSE